VLEIPAAFGHARGVSRVEAAARHVRQSQPGHSPAVLACLIAARTYRRRLRCQDIPKGKVLLILDSITKRATSSRQDDSQITLNTSRTTQ